MADTLIVPDENKIPKEELLLGATVITITDCNGEQVEVHGLTANDLVVKTMNGEVVDLIPYIEQFASSRDEVTNSIIVSSAGNEYPLKAIVDGYEEVSYTLDSMLEKYKNQ